MKNNKPSIVGLRDICTCGSGRTYGACCFRLELAYIVIGLIPAVILFVFHDHLRVLLFRCFLSPLSSLGWRGGASRGQAETPELA